MPEDSEENAAPEDLLVDETLENPTNGTDTTGLSMGTDMGEGDQAFNPPDTPFQENDEASSDDADTFEGLVSEATSSKEEEDDETILTLNEPADEEASLPPADEYEAEGTASETASERTETPEASNRDAMEGGGLSEEERGDLEKLIKDLNKELPADVSALLKRLQKQVQTTEKRVAKLGKLLVAYDRKLKSCYNIMRLQQEKTEMMNERIDAAVDAMTEGK